MAKKVTREAQYSECGSCGTRHLVKAESFGCERCDKTLDMSKPHSDYIEATIFGGDTERAEHYYFCGVRCFIAWFRTFKVPKNYDFISFPLLSGRKKLAEFRALLKAR
jgi:hypothetical protein